MLDSNSSACIKFHGRKWTLKSNGVCQIEDDVILRKSMGVREESFESQQGE